MTKSAIKKNKFGILLLLVTTILVAVGFYWQKAETLLKPSEEPTKPIALDLENDPPPLPEIGAPEAVPEEEILLDYEPETAKEINAATPFAKVPIVPAPAFASALADLDRDRARMCLAIAAIYEAGNAVNDQRPVMQVVLNRVRHPAYPKSVCGVVFQGSERRTGCQFSFTCDGSMARRKPSAAALARASGLAEWMLTEGIDERVGHATHYHTDWVVPYWSSSLNKLAKINTHIFFNWDGYWGRKSAFSNQPSIAEPIVKKMAGFSFAHSDQLEGLEAEEIAALALENTELIAPYEAGLPLNTAEPEKAVLPPPPLTIPTKRLKLSGSTSPGRWALDALQMCGSLPECRVVGWADNSAAPSQLNKQTIAQSPPDFVFVQELRNRVQTSYWDCEKWPKASTSRCLGSTIETAGLVTGG